MFQHNIDDGVLTDGAQSVGAGASVGAEAGAGAGAGAPGGLVALVIVSSPESGDILKHYEYCETF